MTYYSIFSIATQPVCQAGSSQSWYHLEASSMSLQFLFHSYNYSLSAAMVALYRKIVAIPTNNNELSFVNSPHTALGFRQYV
jgi:hypothetical protein